jgi:hypothetical protein
MPVSRLRPVVRLALPIVALALGAAVAVGLVSCGGRDEKGLLPGDTADQIIANLDAVKADARAGDCSSAATEVAAVQQQIDELPSSVDSQLRARLAEGAQNLADVVNSPGACESTTEATTEPTTTEESTTTTTTEKQKTKSTTTTTSPTTTTTGPTTTTTTTPTEPTTGGTPGGGGVVPPGPGQRENTKPGEGLQHDTPSKGQGD